MLERRQKLFEIAKAHFMRQTGLLGQYKALDEDQNDWIAGQTSTRTIRAPKRDRGVKHAMPGKQDDD